MMLAIATVYHRVGMYIRDYTYRPPRKILRVSNASTPFTVAMATTHDDYKPVKAFSLNLGVFTLCGHWSAGIKNRNLRYLYKVWGILAPGICTVAFFILQLINIVLVFGDLQEVMATCDLLVTYVGLMSKFACLRWHSKRVEMLFDKLEEPIFMPRRHEHFDFIEQAMGIVRRDSLFFLSTAISAAAFWSFYPLIDSAQGRELAYVMWCPVDLNNTVIYVGTYSLQVVAVVYNTAINTMMDTTICGLIRMMSGHLEILSLDFTRARSSSELSSEEIHWRLVGCVKYYLAIEGFVLELNNVFEKGMLMQFAASCLIVCVASFELTMVPVASIQFFSIFQYQCCMILQIFIYCWRGNELTIKFSQLSDSIYNSEWIHRTRSFHRCMDVIMSRLQKPMILRLSGLISLSVDTFIAVIKSAYSFYMFLKEVSDN